MPGSTTQSPDVLVIGLGAMGSATLHHLARRGVKVLGIDRYAPPHTHGSTHGQTRVTREAVGEGAAFVPLVRRSHVLWRELERATGTSLLRQCGGLLISRPGQASHMHEQGDFVGNTIALAKQFGIAHELLDTTALASRYPQLQLQGDETAYFEPGAGYVLPEACVTAQLAAAVEAGANIRTGEIVTALRFDGARCVVETDAATYTPGQVIVCAGPWLPTLLDQPFTRQLAIRRQMLAWFEAEEPAQYDESRFPIFIWHWGNRPSDVFYGFPLGAGGVKVGAEQNEISTTADGVDRTVTAAEISALHAQHVAGRLKGVSATSLATATCLYTCAPQANFFIDRLPGQENVIVVSACSGHGFKHSPAIGEAVATFAISGAKPAVLNPFSIV